MLLFKKRLREVFQQEKNKMFQEVKLMYHLKHCVVNSGDIS